MKRVKLIMAAVLSLAACSAFAQAYPNRPIRIVVPYAPGGLPDTMARLVGQRMSESMGQQIVVENRPGAGGISGATEVAKAVPDGYSVMVGDIAQIAINPHLFSKLPYDPLKELTGVSQVGTSPLYLVAHPSVPVNNMQELIALVKREPGKLSYGSSGIGSLHHLATEAIKVGLGLDMVHVPYKGTGQSVPALLGGQVALLYAALPSIESHVKSGKVKILAISTPQRAPQTPDVPTIAESGVPGYDFTAEIGMYVPGGTPPEVISKLNAEVHKALKHPEVAARFKTLGIGGSYTSVEQFNAMNRASYQKYEKVVKASGAKID